MMSAAGERWREDGAPLLALQKPHVTGIMILGRAQWFLFTSWCPSLHLSVCLSCRAWAVTLCHAAGPQQGCF